MLLGGALYNRGLFPAKAEVPLKNSKHLPEAPSTNDCARSSKTNWFTSVADNIDIRILLVGSLLPDIVDKPVGVFLFRAIFDNGRIVCHTLLFTIVIMLAGLYLYRSRGKTWLLVLSFGSLMHIMLDKMWLYPRTFLWPLYGLAFEKVGVENWLYYISHALVTDPPTFISELIGAAILFWFALVLLKRRKVLAFIKCGHIQ